MSDLHPLDLAVITGYFAVVFFFGIRTARRASGTQENFFLAGRKLGRLVQFFLNFGNSTDANGAVSTASLVYQQGVSGVWLGFQMIFLNPYYWFMNLWFRRSRLMTTADLFEDRLGSRGLARFYALFQCLATVVITIGFGNLITYKISSALIVKPEAVWSVSERASVEGYRELLQLETQASTSGAVFSGAESDRFSELRELKAHGVLNSSIPYFRPLSFYLIYTLAVGTYIVLGGMAATAINEIVQSCLIVAFSLIMLPLGFAAIGGAGQLGEKIPEAAFELIGPGGTSQQFTLLVVLGVLANTLVQINGVPGNMPISGSARDEYAARFGAASGTFAKRLMIIMWAFCGLIAMAMFQGTDALGDPDTAWGAMSRRLLLPGLLGLMITGVLAANMSTVAAQSMAVSGLFVRNVWLPLRPRMSEAAGVAAGRWTIVAVLSLGVLAASAMDDVFTMLQFMLTINVPFGAAIMLIFFWRRLSVAGVWTAVVLCFLLNTVAPVVLPRIEAVRSHPSLLVRSEDALGARSPVFFDAVVFADPRDPARGVEGRGRLHTELIVLDALGVDVRQMTPSNRFAARLFFAAFLPFLVLCSVSMVTRPPEAGTVSRFYGKMKTPVGADPESEAEALAATLREPSRFDHLKLFPTSAWEFTKWDRVDTIGFVSCCGVSGAIIGLFWGLLRWVAP
jgi:solute:Na+ symporter, SSS family